MRVARSVYRSPIRDLDSIGTPTSRYRHRSELPSFSTSFTPSVHAENDRATTPSSPGITSSSIGISRGSPASTGGARGVAAAQNSAFAPVASEATSECTSLGGVSSGVGMSPVSLGISEAARADGAAQKAGSGSTSRMDGSLAKGTDESTDRDRHLQRRDSREHMVQAPNAAQQEGAHVVRSGSGDGFDALSQAQNHAIGGGGGDAEHLIDMGEVRDALLDLAVARGELVALAAASPN
jgi:hypothetical protein